MEDTKDLSFQCLHLISASFTLSICECVCLLLAFRRCFEGSYWNHIEEIYRVSRSSMYSNASFPSDPASALTTYILTDILSAVLCDIMALVDVFRVSECQEIIRGFVNGNILLSGSIPIVLAILLSIPMIRSLSKAFGAISMVLALFTVSIAGNGTSYSRKSDILSSLPDNRNRLRGLILLKALGTISRVSIVGIRMGSSVAMTMNNNICGS